MGNRISLCVLWLALLAACNNNKTPETVESKPVTAILPSLPANVVYKNWQMGDQSKVEIIVDFYKSWDAGEPGKMSTYLADTVHFDFPDGTRSTTTKNTAEATLRKWRGAYKETSNIPFSLISLHNNDFDQDWVIAWTWNKWRYADGKKDSVLLAENFRIKNDKIVHMTSLQNSPSKTLLRSLDRIPK